MFKIKYFSIISLVTLGSIFFNVEDSLAASTMRNLESKSEGTMPEPHAVNNRDQQKVHMGLSTGISSPEGSNQDSSEVGVNVGFQPYVPFGVGAELSTTQVNTNTDYARTTGLVRGTYNFGGDLPVIKSSWLGVGTGPVFIPSGVEWALAPMLGFDIPLSTKLHKVVSLGLNAKYLIITDELDALVSNLALKYWF